MPRGTTLRNVRVADPLWAAARAVAEFRDENLSDHVMRPALERYVEEHGEAAGVVMPPPPAVTP